MVGSMTTPDRRSPAFGPGTDDYRGIVDHALTTTRGVRQRLDFDRQVDDQIILDCIDVAEQAPTGGNNGSRRWMIIRDQRTKDRMAELYLSAGVDWVIETAKRLEGSGHQNERMMAGARHLGENIARTPALVIPTIIGRHDGSGRPGLFDSVIQSAWSFQIALRARGLGTVWTTMYLNEAPAVAELLELPDNVTQICLFPVAWTKGSNFKSTSRRYAAREIAYFDRYGHTKLETGPGVVDEIDVTPKPDVVRAAIDRLDHIPSGSRFSIEQVPGGSRVRLHTALASTETSLTAREAIAEIRDVLERLNTELERSSSSGDD
jgi:nitroreductase